MESIYKCSASARTCTSANRVAARLLAGLIRQKPAAVLGMATGSTPLALYRELVALKLNWRKVKTFNLDEYVGISPQHPQSYHHFMWENLFGQVNIDKKNVHIPDGQAADFETSCRQYEQQIKDAGGIDLQLLGIGRDGHIAFNEPGSSLGSRTRVKTLTRETIHDNARFFGGNDQVPRLAITMGVGTILESRRCLLLAIGSSKAWTVRSTIEGPVTAQVTASALQMHQDVIVVLDEQAAAWLTRRAYYAEVEQAQSLLETGQWRQLGIGHDQKELN
ncbi:MAG: glucosamine-6-phosphate deaminase [Verrucomicrobiota bacterium]